ncbi:Undecaprenyl-diphosphatase 1 [Candidatus Hydrogenisulfobacillus filiaventi]|uniref:Undecaprenyl-diphosphatase n=1 Tax=Candidatus Hydrogenisulfobacillus filiaventi TaxID=2707344 RepID=A0A6F8ZE07_9FIRM|nr:undecaprenyl-diphosphate phosphatase [Bacillota bacterium]CAB1127873.1 Undecaprenyl-diphosphatase 1 [Candidatus Hydrogenisulfobacillus filiaventi]
MQWWLALGLGVLQGFAELFPFSSLGLLIVLPRLLALPVPVTGARYLPFLVALHVGTALALAWLFRREWAALITGWVHWLRGRRTPEGHLAWLLIWGTVPVGLLGWLLQHRLAALFGNAPLAAAFLVLNGGIMFLADRFARRRAGRRSRQALGVQDALGIGLWQVFALIPGLSRSGLTIAGGVGRGLGFAEAAHFSFLLATPVILAAGLVELPKLAHGGAHGLGPAALTGGLAAAITAWLSARYLLRYFRTHNLFWFAVASTAAGGLALLLLV